MADTKTLNKVVLTAMTFGGTAAIITGINVGPLISIRLPEHIIGSITELANSGLLEHPAGDVMPFRGDVGVLKMRVC